MQNPDGDKEKFLAKLYDNVEKTTGANTSDQSTKSQCGAADGPLEKHLKDIYLHTV